MLLTGPADLFARGWSQGGDFSWPVTPWVHTAGSENSFLKLFVSATWWLGIFIGAGMIWKRGGRLTDVFCGAIAGAFAGLLAAATLGCLLLILDAVPAALLTRLSVPSGLASSHVLGLIVWVVLAPLCWGILGGGAGFLLSGLGQRGLRLLALAAEPLAWIFRQCGFERAAAFFLLQG
jgi:hypothetical protein